MGLQQLQGGSSTKPRQQPANTQGLTMTKRSRRSVQTRRTELSKLTSAIMTPRIWNQIWTMETIPRQQKLLRQVNMQRPVKGGIPAPRSLSEPTLLQATAHLRQHKAKLSIPTSSTPQGSLIVIATFRCKGIQLVRAIAAAWPGRLLIPPVRGRR